MGVKNNSISIIYLSIIFGLFGTQYPVNCQFDNFAAIVAFGLTSYQTMDGIHDTVLKFETASTDDIMEKVADLSASVDMWGNKLASKLEEMDTFIRRLPLLEEISSDMRVLLEYFARIDTLYDEFEELREDPASFNDDTIKDLIETFTSREGDDVVGTINKLHGLVVPDKYENYKKSVVLLLAQETQEYALEICDIGVPQYRLFDFYSIIATMEMKALTMTSTGYLIKSLQSNTSYMGEIKRTNNRFIARMESSLILFRNAMAISSKQFRRCDPSEGYIRDVSFYEFERFLQGVVTNEILLVPDDDCLDSCNSIAQPTRMYDCTSNFYCKKSEPQCGGSINHCQSMNLEAYTCENRGIGPRRLEWVRDGWGKLSPDETTECATGTHYYKGDWAPHTFHNCDICRCICIEDNVSGKSTHFINLREQLSDVANNRVIVGLQFSILKRIAQFEILQGLLGPNGTIDEDTVDWIDLQDIQYHMNKSIESNSFKFFKTNEDGSQEELIEDEDIAVLKYNSRRINLDKLTVPSKQVVTGIKFVRELHGSSEKSLHLEIQATPFDYESGKLDIENSVWIGPKDTSYAKNAEIRTKYEGESGRNPEKSRVTSIDTKPNTYINIHWTSWDEDASQTVVPLLDALPVYAEPLIPLIGVGLYHKKQKGYDGFLTLVLEGFDKSLYIDDKVEDEKPKKEKPRKKGRRRS